MKILAIIIGNNNYFSGYELTNAENDAKEIAKAFDEYNYDVKLYLNITKEQISEILVFYETQLKDYDVSIFYFAGHGFEVDGENFLASTESQIPPANIYSAKQDCIILNDLFSIYRKNPTKLNIIILDACRKSFDRGNTIGFSPIFTPKGSMIAFSTSPNESASDKGYEKNSIYTGTLLKHLQTERISVEDLFKAVRKTVYTLSDGRQTTWEHTSLIGDFYFYKKQNLDILSLPYEGGVLKDENYYEDNEFGNKISELKTYNWYRQNPALDYLLSIPKSNLTKDQMFIMGRNLLQCAIGGAKSTEFFFSNLNRELLKFQTDKENHLLNGILFEMYYDSKGEFRFNRCKGELKDNIFNLRENPVYEGSFKFMQDILIKQDYNLIYMPSDDVLNLAVKANQQVEENYFGREEIQKIEAISYNNIRIEKQISKYYIDGYNEFGLKKVISQFLNAPIEKVVINSNMELKNIRFKHRE